MSKSNIAEQITADQLTAAAATAVRRAVKDQANRPQGAADSLTPFIGFMPPVND
jgi:hypothetical protein